MQTAPSLGTFQNELLNHPSNRTPKSCMLFSSQDESSGGGGLFSRLKDKVIPSKDNIYKNQMEKMAQTEYWTLADFNDQIQSSMDWKSKLPGIGDKATVQQMKSMGKLLDAAIEVMGRDSGSLELNAMDKKEKVLE